MLFLDLKMTWHHFTVMEFVSRKPVVRLGCILKDKLYYIDCQQFLQWQSHDTSLFYSTFGFSWTHFCSFFLHPLSCFQNLNLQDLTTFGLKLCKQISIKGVLFSFGVAVGFDLCIKTYSVHIYPQSFLLKKCLNLLLYYAVSFHFGCFLF